MHSTALLWIIYVEFSTYTALQKFGKALEKWGFGQYWHEYFLICDNFALIRDNPAKKNNRSPIETITEIPMVSIKISL